MTDAPSRVVSKGAIAALVLALFSLTAIVAWPLAVIPVLTIFAAVVALRSIARYPDELSGRRLAQLALVIGILALVGSCAWHTYVYATEVREGYERISFRTLRDDPATALPYSEAAAALDGKKVFLKGWVRPGDRRTGLKQFILVGDFGSCCFGGNPKITDVVGVVIESDQTVDYSLRLRKVHGTFRLNRQAARTSESEVPRVFYQIEADDVR
jgi:hypothetical protein